VPRFELEYTICLIQRNIFSFARKSHRQEGGNPVLDIDDRGGNVVWTLEDLEHGVPEAEEGRPAVDRIDFYFRREVLQLSFPTFPAPAVPPDDRVRFPPRNPVGYEREEGTRVRLVHPVCRFIPITAIRLVAAVAPAFEATAAEGTLHLDIETGPAKIYGVEIFEYHFGVQAQYELARLPDGAGPSLARFEMSPVVYSTIVRELRRVLP
jgi:hypothetical protein